MLADRENDERKLLLAGQQIPQLTLAQALTYARGYVPSTHKSEPSASKKSLSVFTLDSAAANPDIQAACELLAGTVANATPDKVLLALKNSFTGKEQKKSTDADTSSSPLMVHGRPWTKVFSVKGCNKKDPGFMHTLITGQPVDEPTQKRMDAYAAKQAERKKKEEDRVMVTTKKDDDSDDDGAPMYFVHMNKVKEHDDNGDDSCYSTNKSYVLMNMDITLKDAATTNSTPFDPDRLLLDNQAGHKHHPERRSPSQCHEDSQGLSAAYRETHPPSRLNTKANFRCCEECGSLLRQRHQQISSQNVMQDKPGLTSH